MKADAEWNKMDRRITPQHNLMLPYTRVLVGPMDYTPGGLHFLPAGRYRATVWEDGEAPDEVRRSERIVTARDALALRLSSAGGAAVILEPSDR